jgi:hypothetical protein
VARVYHHLWSGCRLTRLAHPGLCVVNTHPVANWDGDWSRASRFYPLHRAQLASLARIVRGIGVPAVVCGDFNVDRDSSLFGEAPARMLPVAPPVAPDDEFLECTETVSSHPRTGIGVFKRDAEVGGEVGRVADLALCPEDFP